MSDNPHVLMAISLGLILTCVIVIVLFIIFVHTMPGRIARKRNNPQAEAIEILSLLGLLLFPLWMVALVWAYVSPFSMPVRLIEELTGPADEAGPLLNASAPHQETAEQE